MRFYFFVFGALLFVGPVAKGVANSGKVLIVLSGSDHLTLKSGAKHPTGYYLPELVLPLVEILQAGYEVRYANPSGRKPAMDPSSDSASHFKSEAEYLGAKLLLSRQEQLNSPIKLSSLKEKELSEFDAIFVPGGHAPMEDLYKNKELGRILEYFHRENKPTGLLCHGPIALLSSKLNQNWIYHDYRMTVFSTAEEKQAEANNLGGAVLFYPDSALKKAGGKVITQSPWTSHIVVDRELITGQNPQSAHAFSYAFRDALLRRKSDGRSS